MINKIEVSELNLHHDDERLMPPKLQGRPVENALLKLVCADGIVGVAEAICHPSYMGETRENVFGCVKLLNRHLAALKSVTLADLPRFIDKIFGGHGAIGIRFALDVAMHDALGKAYGTPVYKLLGGGIGSVKEIPLLATVFAKDAEDMAVEAERYAKAGFSALEIKCNGFLLPPYTLEADVNKIKSVLEAVGEHVTVVADCNQSWKFADAAIRTLNRDFKGVTNLYIEQPLHFEDDLGLAEITHKVDIPVVVDESATSPRALQRLISRQCGNVVSIKPARVGGLRTAMQMAAIADAAGWGVRFDWIFSSRISDTALAHCAVNVPQVVPLAADAHARFIDDIVLPDSGIQLAGSTASLPDAPGLGVVLRDSA